MFTSFIGLRGCGKSSYACKIAKKYIRKGIPVYSNFPIKGCYLYDITDIGRYQIENCCLILDEAGIDISNRDYADKYNKSTSKPARQWWKLSRHYGVTDIYVFSQAFDFDITLRRLSDSMYIMKRGLLPHTTRLYRLKQHWDVDKDGQPQVVYEVPRIFKPFFRRKYYKMFDSYSAPTLPHKDFTLIQ